MRWTTMADFLFGVSLKRPESLRRKGDLMDVARRNIELVSSQVIDALGKVGVSAAIEAPGRGERVSILGSLRERGTRRAP